MPQETNLNVSPYFDDFDSSKDYYKVLFKPGYPIQARELTSLQSILQNQVEQYGKHIFKEGSVVLGGDISYDSPFYCVEIESSFNGSPISLYYDQLLGKRIVGSTSGVSAEIVYTITDIESERQNYTLYLKYLGSGGVDFTNKTFQDGETLILQSPLTYNNFTIQAGQGFCNTISENSISEGSGVSIKDGVFFVRGFFANTKSQTIILDQYSRNPSYKIGFNIIEKIVTSYEDETLYDNAQGFSNYAAPGSDRFKLELQLDKKTLDDNETESFVEIMRIEKGVQLFVNKNSTYSLIRDELARRTSDESGDYFVKPFILNVRDSLNDGVLNRGIYFKDQTTIGGKTPSEDLMIYQISPGKAYVNGYDVETISTRLLDAPKARTTSSVNNLNINFNAGSICVVNNTYGSPRIGIGTTSIVKLMNSRIGSNPYVPSGEEIGIARVYDFIPETDYIDQTSRFNLRLFDIETYTTITLTNEITLSVPSVIKGKRSKSIGYLRQNVSNSKTLSLYEVSGNFLENEPISINEVDNNRLIENVIDYDISDVKSIYSQTGISTFNCDTVLSTQTYISTPGTTFNINNGLVSVGLNNNFINVIKVGDIVSYASTTYTGTPIFNKVSSVSAGGTSFVLSGITTVSGICNGSLPAGQFQVTNITRLRNSLYTSDSSLYTEIGSNISSVKISETEIIQRKLFSSVAVLDNNSINVTIDPGEPDIFFESFDEDRFIITYSDGTREPIRSDKFFVSPDLKLLTFNGLTKNSGTADVIATVVNKSPNSKIKRLNKTSSLVVSNSKLASSGIGTTTLNDGLTYSTVYGTRVQDDEICLNVPDIVRVLAIYESNSVNDPKLPILQLSGFTGTSNNNQDYVIGEKITGLNSGAVAIITSKKDSDKLEYVGLNVISFELNEIIEGEDSKTQSIVISKILGDKNITQNFILDNGIRDSYYDYGRIVRKNAVTSPTKKIKIIFQNYTIDSNDTGEFITANSYPVDGFQYDVPIYGGVRMTDVLDIRPRVSPYTDLTKSPFEFYSRNFASDGQYSNYIIAPNENLLLSYSYYQGRIDLINLNPDGIFEIVQGTPSDYPIAPSKVQNCLDIAYVFIPPYVFNVENVTYKMSEHRRYRMSDISLLEDRIDRVEKYTTLSMLESKTENFSIVDAETGLNRFKCGFFVDDFSSHDSHDVANPSFRAAIDLSTNTLRAPHYTTSLDLQLGSEVITGVAQTYSPNLSHSFVSDLGSPGVKKTGDLITLNYDEVLYYNQPYATKTESVTPFLVRFWSGLLELRPPIDTWIEERTDRTYSFATSKIVGDPLPDINITKTVNRTQNNTTYRNETKPATGAGPGTNWISNLSAVNSSYYNSTLPPAFSVAIAGGKAKLTNGKINIGVARKNINRFTIGPLKEYINKIFPGGVANKLITEIESKPLGNPNDNQILYAEFTPSTPTFSREQSLSVKTSQSSSSRTETRTIPPKEINLGDTITQSVRNSIESVNYLRSRNIEFDSKGLRPLTRFYAFFEGIDIKNYITPKLLEIEMISGKFDIGEEVESSPTFINCKLKFRLCTPNHKFGDAINPRDTFRYIPYTQQAPPTSYSESSTFLNVDTNSLSVPSEKYYGLASVGMTLIGKQSKAIARITNIRLISDHSGRLLGSFFIPDSTISSNPKWINGDNTFTLIDIPVLSPNLFETQDIIIPDIRSNQSTAEAEFTTSASRRVTHVNVLTTRNIKIIPAQKINTTTITNTTTNTTEITTEITLTGRTQNFITFNECPIDPLAQSFYVRDENGIFLTSVELFFELKDEDIPVTIQIRPMTAGVPSNMIVPFSEVTLSPDEVNMSLNGSVGTKFTFPSPVYLSGPKNQSIRDAPIGSQQVSEYAIVILSPSPSYRVFIAEQGKFDLLNPNFRISDQFDTTLGSLFKSQNGTTWNPSQLEDLKYKIYRANFVQNGLVRFFNPILGIENEKVTITGDNQFALLSKKIVVGLASTGYNSSIIVPGVNITQGNAIGTLTGIAGSISVGTGVTISKVGSGYTSGTFSGVSLITETGYGSGAIVTININEQTSGIGTVTVTSGGMGYQIGDSLIVPEIGSGVGYGGKVTVSNIASNNTFVLDNVQGDFSVGITTLNYQNSSGNNIPIGSGVVINSITQDQYYTGKHMKVYQLNHGMHSSENYVKISKFRPEYSQVNSELSSDISTNEVTSIPLTSAGIGFTQFEGVAVDGTNIGYVIIGEEVVGYSSVTGNSLTSLIRGIDGTEVQSHSIDDKVYKYELNGISLRRINKVHNLSFVDQSIHPTTLNSYHVEIDLSDEDYNGDIVGANRTDDLYFLETIQTGDMGTNITNNIQFECITPNIANIVLPNTSISPRVRTFSGTSIGGNEKSFVDKGFETISLDYTHYFDSPRLICSDVNELRFINESPGNRSLTMEFVMNSNDSRLSPVIDTIQSSVVLTSNLINNPIGIDNNQGYADDDSIRSLTSDKHSAIYISKIVRLKLPANSLKVILSSNMNNENDIRVLYQTFRSDSSGNEVNFNLFPGWSNYQIDGQKIKRVIDFSQNDGSPDSKVIKSSDASFKDYEFSVDDLADFEAFSIKIVMSSINQANPPLISDLRAIATVKPRL